MNLLKGLFGRKRYHQLDDDLIVDEAGMTYTRDRRGSVKFKSTNPDITTSQNSFTGKEAEEVWKDLVKRTKNPCHRFYSHKTED